MTPVPEIFEQTKIVIQDDLDEMQHVNNVQYVQWIQDIAKAHWESRASDKLKEKYFWVVTRHEIDYKQQAFLNDELLIQTFVGTQTYVTSTRIVNISNKITNKLLVQASSTWCLLDLKTKKPAKISEEMLRIFYK